MTFSWQSNHNVARLLIAGLCFAGWAAADAPGQTEPLSLQRPPLHPSIILSAKAGRFYPVVAVAAETPKIAVGHRVIRQSVYAQFRIERAPRFAPGSVEIVDSKAKSRLDQGGVRFHSNSGEQFQEASLGPPVGHGTYDCTVVSPEDHPNCFLAVNFFTQLPNGTPDRASMIVGYQEIGDLRANQPKNVHMDNAYVAQPGVHFYGLPMVFTGGFELRSNYALGAARYFRGQEVRSHGALVEAYLAKYRGADRPAAAYLQFPPIVDQKLLGGLIPAALNVQYTVTPTGEVNAVDFIDQVDPRVADIVRRTLSAWLYLPQLMHGQAVTTVIHLRLSFPKEKGARRGALALK